MPGQLGGLAADERDAGLAADLGGALDELGDGLEVDAVRRDVVEEEAAGRRRVVITSLMQCAARSAPHARSAPRSPREDELRPDRVGRGGEEAVGRRAGGARRTRRSRSRRSTRRPRAAARRPRRPSRSRRRRPRTSAPRPRAERTVHRVDEPSLLTSWTLDPLQLAPIALIAVAYAVRARTLSRRGQPVPGWRIALFALGIALLVVAVASPIAASARRSSSRSTWRSTCSSATSRRSASSPA